MITNNFVLSMNGCSEGETGLEVENLPTSVDPTKPQGLMKYLFSLHFCLILMLTVHVVEWHYSALSSWARDEDPARPVHDDVCWQVSSCSHRARYSSGGCGGTEHRWTGHPDDTENIPLCWSGQHEYPFIQTIPFVGITLLRYCEREREREFWTGRIHLEY